MEVLCPVSLGELVDKLSILLIKVERIEDKSKRAYAREERDRLQNLLSELNLDGIDEDLANLVEVNSQLWEIEDAIRLKERDKVFNEEFIKLARRVYQVNDQRFELKKAINERFGSTLCEVKSYQKYD